MSTYNVIKFQAPFERLKEYDLSPEIRLNKSIITQAIIDVSNNSDSPRAKKIELEAREWFFGNSQDFQDACQRADLDPNNVIKMAKSAIELNKKEINHELDSAIKHRRKK